MNIDQLKEVESAKVTLKLVAETTSDEDKPNCNSACDMYELKFIDDIPAGIIAAPPSLEKFDAVTGVWPLAKSELTFFF